MLDIVVDVSHHNGPNLDFAAAARSGVSAVIHKATQGTHYLDPMLAVNKPAIVRENLLFGVYHFGDGSNGSDQAKFFLDAANPQPGQLVGLDFEANPAGPSMTLEEARAFVTVIHNAIGKWPVLYAGHYLKDALTQHPDALLANCPLWLAQYGSAPVLPPGWRAWSLWQYTDGLVGHPSPVTGIGHCDRNWFAGASVADLQPFWASVSR